MRVCYIHARATALHMHVIHVLLFVLWAEVCAGEVCNAGYRGGFGTSNTDPFSANCVACVPGKYKDYSGTKIRLTGVSQCRGDVSRANSRNIDYVQHPTDTIDGRPTYNHVKNSDSCGADCQGGLTIFHDSTNGWEIDSTEIQDGQPYWLVSTDAKDWTDVPRVSWYERCYRSSGWYDHEQNEAVMYNMGCTPCPSNSASQTASTTLRACQCTAGFTGPNGGPCVACVAGKHKSAEGPNDCALCPNGKYKTAPGPGECIDISWRFSCIARTVDSTRSVLASVKVDRAVLSRWVGGDVSVSGGIWTPMRYYFNSHENTLHDINISVVLTAYDAQSKTEVDVDALQVVRAGMYDLEFTGDTVKRASITTNAHEFGAIFVGTEGSAGASTVLGRAQQGAWDAVSFTVEVQGSGTCTYTVVPVSTRHGHTGLEGALRGMACDIEAGGMCMLTIPKAELATDGSVQLRIECSDPDNACTVTGGDVVAAVFSQPYSAGVVCGANAEIAANDVRFLPMYYNRTNAACTPCAQVCSTGMYIPSCYTDLDVSLAHIVCVPCPLRQYLVDMNRDYVPVTAMDHACRTGCRPGFAASGGDDMPCVQCARNTYSLGGGAQGCTGCGGLEETLGPGSTRAADCLPVAGALCPAGLGMQGGVGQVCEPCPLHTYNNGSQSTSECTACPGNTKTAARGARAAHECAFCGRDSYMLRAAVPGMHDLHVQCQRCEICTFIAEHLHAREACVECEAFLQLASAPEQREDQCPRNIKGNSACYRRTPIQHLHDCNMDVFTRDAATDSGGMCDAGRCQQEFQIDSSYSRARFESQQPALRYAYLDSVDARKRARQSKCQGGSGVFNFCRLQAAIKTERPVFYVTSGYTAFNLSDMDMANAQDPAAPTYRELQGNYDCAVCYDQQQEPYHGGYMTIYTFQNELPASVRRKTRFFDFTRLGFQYFSNEILPGDLRKCRERFTAALETASSSNEHYIRDSMITNCYQAYDPNMMPLLGAMDETTPTCSNANLAPRSVEYPAGKTEQLCITNNVRVELALLEAAVHAHYGANYTARAQPPPAQQQGLTGDVRLGVRIRAAAATTATTVLRVTRLRVVSDNDAMQTLTLSCAPGDSDSVEDCTRVISDSDGAAWEVSASRDTVTMNVSAPSADLLAALFGGEWSLQITLDDTDTGAMVSVEAVLCESRASVLRCIEIANATLSADVPHTPFAYESCSATDYELRKAQLQNGEQFELMRRTVAEKYVCGMLDETNTALATSTSTRTQLANELLVDNQRCHSDL